MSTSADGMLQWEIGAGRCEAAGAARGNLAERGCTTVPGAQRAPTRSLLSHVERDNPVGVRVKGLTPGGSTVRKAEFPDGRRMAQEANAGGRKAAGNREPDAGSSASGCRITGRIEACALTREGADVGRVSLRGLATDDAGTKGQVGRHDHAGCDKVVDGGVAVNGPEGEVLDWDAIDWRAQEDNVRRLRQRIFAASWAGDLKKVRNLQKLMLRSRSNALLAVRRVTEQNAGRKTAGVDGKVVVLPTDKADLAGWVQRHAAPWSPLPVKRVYVPKRNGRRRGLGIPTGTAYCAVALVL